MYKWLDRVPVGHIENKKQLSDCVAQGNNKFMYFYNSLFVSTLTNTWSWVVHILQIYIQTAHTVQMTAYSNSDMTSHNFLIIYMFVYNIHFYDDEIHINKNIIE